MAVFRKAIAATPSCKVTFPAPHFAGPRIRHVRTHLDDLNAEFMANHRQKLGRSFCVHDTTEANRT